MKKLFTRRRLLASVGGSLLLHAALFVGWPRQIRSQPARGDSSPISLEVIRAVRPAGKLVAMAGERPSGRGHALAGSNPSKAGTPRHAPRTQAASGRSAGAGATGAAPELVPLPAAAAGEVASNPDVVAPTNDAPANAAPSVAADDLFDRLAREQRMRLANGNGGGLAGFGEGGDGTGIGLRTEISGRQVVESHVASAPVAIRAPPVECVVGESLRLNATVRVLVTRAGEAAVPRLALSSGQRGFDACAVRYVLGMRFSPGLDAAGHALDVWMDVRVTPLAAGPVGVAP